MSALIPFLTCVVLPSWRAADHDERPSLSGPEHVVRSPGGLFDIHYTLEGEDAVPAPLEAGLLPEAVEWAIEGLEMGVTAFQDRGYRSLTGDGGGGGSDAIDVYIKDINANGYANAIPAGDGVGSSCYIRLSNGLPLDGVMQSVAIHELHHCVEYRYTTDAASWIYEATATFEQYRTYLDENLALAVIVLYGRRLGEPGLPMDWTDGDFEYAGMVAMQFWEQFGGLDPLRIPGLWSTLATQPDWREALDSAARRSWDLSWDEAFLEYATWNAFACAYRDGSGYDESELPCNDIVAIPLREKSWEEGQAIVRVKLSKPGYNADYWTLPDDEPLLDVGIQCEAPRLAASEVQLRLVAVDAHGNRGAHADTIVDGDTPVLRLSGPRTPGGSLRLIAANLGTGPLNLQCALTQDPPRADLDTGCGCRTGAPIGSAWLLAAALLGLRRRGSGSPPGSSSSSRSWPR